MESEINNNLVKLNELLRRQTSKKPCLQPSKYSKLHLMLARSVSISTEQSSRMIQLNSKQSSQITNKSKNSKLQQYFMSKRVSLAQEVRKCDSYAQKHKIERKFTLTDNVCGLQKILEYGRTPL